MWSDIETDKDLLGFTVHANLLKDIVTNEKNLPITIGLYGDWGSGKSSVLKILEQQLKNDEETIVIYFDGWSFESFDDAKLALIQGIVDELNKSERLWEKIKDKGDDFVSGIKEAFKKLKDSINWMRVLKVTTKAVIPIASSSMTGGVSLIPLLVSAFNDNKGNLENLLTGDKAEEFLNEVLQHKTEDGKYEAVREFRKDFEKLIKKTTFKKVVILIDDLDRCLPRHIIDSLEAIKLFLNVPGTAFIIAADEYIVTNAIKSEYNSLFNSLDNENKKNIGELYMEKFIQLPYRLPSLSNREVETYVNLLFCQSELPVEIFNKIQTDFIMFSQQNKFNIYSWDNIKKNIPNDQNSLHGTIGFISRFSSIISVALRRNPRLIKRFLNAYEVRSTLLKTSGIDSQNNRFALLKLMLLEFKHNDLFHSLCEWVFCQTGTPKELIDMEKAIDGKKGGKYPSTEWEQSDVKTLIDSEPRFSSVDLRELYWVSRDKLSDIIGGTSLYSAKVKELFRKVCNASSDPILNTLCTQEVAKLTGDDNADFFTQLDELIILSPKEKKGYNIYLLCIENNIDGAYQRFFKTLENIDVTLIPFSLGNKFADVYKIHPDEKFPKLLSSNEELIRAIKTAKQNGHLS